jgi:polyhydroxybutyrate depolymerase
VTHRVYDCPDGADVEMYIVAGGGHAWPGSEFSKGVEQIIGPTTFDIDATDLIWEFFQRFRRAG